MWYGPHTSLLSCWFFLWARAHSSILPRLLYLTGGSDRKSAPQGSTPCLPDFMWPWPTRRTHCASDFLLPASRSCNPSFPFLGSCSWARIPESPKAPGNARSGHTHSQHQLLEVPRQLSSDAGFDWLPSGLQILIKH